MFSSGILFVIAGPSGAGKTTLAHHLVKSFNDTDFSVSSTTRSPRGSEVHGKDYFFVDAEEFKRRIEGSFFLEWAEVHGNFYGTDGEWVRRELSRGRSVVLDIDVQGAVQIKQAVPSAVLAFVLPASPDVLRTRLQGRSTDSPETVRSRMLAAAGEVACLGSFDYFILNDELSRAEKAVEAIFKAERMKLKNHGWPLPAFGYSPEYMEGLTYWKDKRVVVSSGPTREMIDDVRYISNRSSGLMGVSLAEAFLASGAEVTLVSGPARVMDPPGAVKLVKVQSAAEMKEVLSVETIGADLLAMAAAVADYAPSRQTSGKMERGSGEITLELRPTDDIAGSLSGNCPVLAFALEYGHNAVERAQAKLERKEAEAIFLNMGDVPGEGMETMDNAGRLIFSQGRGVIDIPRGSKLYTAFGIAAALGRTFGKVENG